MRVFDALPVSDDNSTTDRYTVLIGSRDYLAVSKGGWAHSQWGELPAGTDAEALGREIALDLLDDDTKRHVKARMAEIKPHGRLLGDLTGEHYYLNPAFILGADKTGAPRHNSASGYGCKIPTRHRLHCADGKTRRVYVICYSNAGSAYVLVGGQRFFIDAECEQRIEKEASA